VCACVNQPALQLSTSPTAPASVLCANNNPLQFVPPLSSHNSAGCPLRKAGKLTVLLVNLFRPSMAMFTRSIALRLTRCSCSKSSPRVAYQYSHQRRLSSSKASVPPDGASRGRSSAPSQQDSSSGRSRGRKSKLFSADRDFANLPAVPPTHHLGLESELFGCESRCSRRC
jgi:hypothetical protein